MTACTPEKKIAAAPEQIDPAKFDGKKVLFEAVGLVGQGSRDGGTPGAEKAANYLAKRLQGAGVAADMVNGAAQSASAARRAGELTCMGAMKRGRKGRSKIKIRITSGRGATVELTSAGNPSFYLPSNA